jgi:hypothetical protein
LVTARRSAIRDPHVCDDVAAADAGHRDDGRTGGAAMTLPFARDPAEPFTFGDLDPISVDGRRWELTGDADPDAGSTVTILNGIPGACEHAIGRQERAHSGESIALEDL